jgi:hypothetical protein
MDAKGAIRFTPGLLEAMRLEHETHEEWRRVLMAADALKNDRDREAQLFHLKAAKDLAKRLNGQISELYRVVSRQPETK